MAEVPEVETIVRDLREAVVGSTFTSVEVLRPETVRFPPPAAFAERLIGQTITAAQRRAKHILLPLSGDLLLEIHFMLWGTLRLLPAAASRVPETLIVFGLNDGQALHLRDKLGYARVALAPPTDLVERLKLDTLGPDALDPSFSVAVLAERIGRRRGVLKTVLLNQRIVAGLGNRDADESLWHTRIDPRRPAASLTAEELARLHAAIQSVLAEGIDLRGTQTDLFGRQGQAKHRRNVFERAGQPCPRCGATIAHVRIGGRNTFYCPQCQH